MKYLKFITLLLTLTLLTGCVFNDPKYINLTSKSTPYYYSDEIYKKLNNKESFTLKVFDVNFYEYFDVSEEDSDILLSFFKSLNKDNYDTELDPESNVLKYRLIIDFKDSKFAINVYDENTISVFPWDGNLEEDLINMKNVPKYNNIFYFCKYIINKSHSNE